MVRKLHVSDGVRLGVGIIGIFWGDLFEPCSGHPKQWQLVARDFRYSLDQRAG